MPRREWERATGIGGRVRGYLPQYWPRGLEPTLVDFDGGAVGPFRSSFDVAGDGRLAENLGTPAGSRKVQLANGRALVRLRPGAGPSAVSLSSAGLPTVVVMVTGSR